jgi:geranylgeranyl pyrophosphate synthase
MRYAVLGGGKRVRPVLVYASGVAVGGRVERLDGPACAVELVHAYSLVHDDLPAMDDDDLRRGRPTCHKAFGEATALLAGDALQVLAFSVLVRDENLVVPAPVRLEMIATLAEASGSLGMAGGQAIDLEAVGRTMGLPQLEDMHARKTGALIRASVMLGALGSECAQPQALDALARYASAVGLAFQVQDDVLDVAGETRVIGKTRGADEQRQKPTFPALLGLAGAQDKARDLRAQAEAALVPLGPRADLLRDLAAYIVERAY